MKKVLVLAILLSASIALADDAKEKVTEYMTAHVATGNYNGAVLIAKGDDILVHSGFGMYDLEKGIKASKGHKFELGSLAKSFTAISILQLQEKGLLSVDDKVSKFLPVFPNGDKITLHHLLTHSSGLVEFENTLVFKPLDRIIRSIQGKALLFQPGQKAVYSTSGFVILRKIIELLTKRSHQQYVVENIMKPAGMTSSGFNHGHRKIKNLGPGYWNGGEGLEVPESHDKSAQGSLYSTTGDLLLLVKALQDKTLLSKASKEQMFSSKVKDAGITNMGHGYGYGWAIDESHGKKRVWHNGHIFGFCAMLAMYPEVEVAIIVLSNIQNNSPVEKISEALAAIVFGKEYTLPKIRKEVVLGHDQLLGLAGTYEYSPDFHIEVTVSGNKIYLQGTGQPRFRLRPMNELQFFMNEADIEIHFVRVGAEIKELVIHQYENKMPAKRISPSPRKRGDLQNSSNPNN